MDSGTNLIRYNMNTYHPPLIETFCYWLIWGQVTYTVSFWLAYANANLPTT